MSFHLVNSKCIYCIICAILITFSPNVKKYIILILETEKAVLYNDLFYFTDDAHFCYILLQNQVVLILRRKFV
jgi:hypothetical protein